MPHVKDPDFVSGAKPPYKIQPTIIHPAFCVCDRCSKLPANEREKEHSVRIFRASPFPDSRVQTSVHARDVKRDLERELRAAVDALRLAKREHKTFGDLTDAYRAHQRAEGKRLDRNEYVIAALERHFERDSPADAITKAAYREYVQADENKHLSAETLGRHTRILVAILNSAVRDGLIPSHDLKGIRRPISKRRKKPVTFTARQLELLRGEAIDAWEKEQQKEIEAWNPKSGRVAPTPVPLRGFCLIAYRTLMRPDNNFGLEWSQVSTNPKKKSGRFNLDKHKNVSRGVEVEAPLHPELVMYLAGLPRNGRWVHPNPKTHQPYKNVRRQWLRLVEITNEMLRKEGSQEMTGKRAEFYTWRHTGASRLAASGGDPILIVRMMGDVDLGTVMAHYFDSAIEHMQEMVERWE